MCRACLAGGRSLKPSGFCRFTASTAGFRGACQRLVMRAEYVGDQDFWKWELLISGLCKVDQDRSSLIVNTIIDV